MTPLIGVLGGQPDFSGLSLPLNGSEIRYGAFLNALIAFLIIAAVIFFAVVKPMNALLTRMRTEPTPDPLTGKCPLCLSGSRWRSAAAPSAPRKSSHSWPEESPMR